MFIIIIYYVHNKTKLFSVGLAKKERTPQKLKEILLVLKQNSILTSQHKY